MKRYRDHEVAVKQIGQNYKNMEEQKRRIDNADLLEIDVGVLEQVAVCGAGPAKEKGEGRGTVRSNHSLPTS